MLLQSFIRILWLAGILAMQVLLFDHINVGGLVVVTVYPWFAVMLPQGTTRVGALLWAFVMGMGVDMMNSTPGLSAAALTLVGFIQPILLRMATPKDAIEGFTPSATVMGTWVYVRYVLVLMLAHHLLYFSLEAFTMARWQDSLLRMGLSLAVSYVMVLCLEMVRERA